ncbi:MAG: hypothetical protein GXO62_08340 [Epsilonproteobacteria bacterium]|nr:hypothetical protein [Campylobacterota bacterium]
MKLFIIIALFFIGCVDKEGIYFRYYKNCKENYALYGVYYKDCKPDINFCNGCDKKRICLDCN